MYELAKIGDVVMFVGEPPDSNPYRGTYGGESLSGDARVAALEAFRDGGDISGLTFWHAPPGGGASRLTDPSNVDWRGMR